MACVLASSMAFIDGTALTVALPSLKQDLGADLASVQWVVNAYILALASLTLIGGAVADARGRRNTLIWGCAVFAVASATCALAPTVSVLIVARFVQGMGAALVTPASLALIGEVYPQSERSAAIGAWAAASALTTAAGPLLGGWLTENFGWEAVFWINPPLAAGAIALLWSQVPAGARKSVPFDVLGAGLLTLALGAAACTVTAPDHFVEAAVVTVVAGGLFVVHESRISAPMMPFYLFRRTTFARLNLATLLIYAGLAVATFLLPFDLVERRGLSPATAGVSFVPFTLAVGLLSRRFGALADRGSAPFLIGGPVVAGLGFGLLGGLAQASFTAGVLIPMGVVGLGFALLVAPLTAGVMSSVDDADTGLASGINNTASRIAQFIGVALAGLLASQGMMLGMSVAGALTALGGLSLAGLALGRPSPASEAPRT